MIKVKVNYKTDKYRLRQVMNNCKKYYLKVGVKDGLEDLNLNNISIYEAYRRNEFGYPPDNIPERSYIRKPIKDKATQLFEEYGKQIVVSIFKTGVKETLNDVGKTLENHLTENLHAYRGLDGNWEANAPLTIFMKGFDFPLYADGTLRNSIGHKVEKGE